MQKTRNDVAVAEKRFGASVGALWRLALPRALAHLASTFTTSHPTGRLSALSRADILFYERNGTHIVMVASHTAQGGLLFKL